MLTRYPKFLVFLLLALLWGPAAWASPPPPPAKPRPGRRIDDVTLKRALSRAITMYQLCAEKYPDETRREQQMAALDDIGARFIGRTALWWNNTYGAQEEEAHFQRTYVNTSRLLATDSSRIVQAGVMEFIAGRDPATDSLTSINASTIPVPAWVLRDWGLPVVKRNFDARAIAYAPKDADDPWRGMSEAVPDVTRLEARLWLYYRACRYMACGIEALHMGQWNLISNKDKRGVGGKRPYYYTNQLFDKIRAFAANGSPYFEQPNGRKGARHGYVVLDFHSKEPVYYRAPWRRPVDLFDFYSNPISAREVLTGGQPGGLYGYPAWSTLLMPNECALPGRGALANRGNPRLMLVELDNSLSSPHAPSLHDPTQEMWGWDEITWFAAQPCAYRSDWLCYVYRWLQCNAPNTFMEMPGRRSLSSPTVGSMYEFENPASARPHQGQPCAPAGGVSLEQQRLRELWRGEHDDYYPGGTLPGPDAARPADGVAVEGNGSVYWIEAATGQIRHGQWDVAAARWQVQELPGVADAADNLLVLAPGQLIYRSSGYEIKFCQYTPAPDNATPGTWTTTATGVANAAGALTLASSGPLHVRQNLPTVYYRSRQNTLDYVARDSTGRWLPGRISPADQPDQPITVDVTEGAIISAVPGTVFYIANQRLQAVRATAAGWRNVPAPALPARSHLAVEKIDTTTNIIVYSITPDARVAFARYNHHPVAPRWDSVAVSGHAVIEATAGAAGDIIVTGNSQLLYRTGAGGIRSLRWCQGYLVDYYPRVQDCVRGLTRQPDNGLYYLGRQGELRYLGWDAPTCSWSEQRLAELQPAATRVARAPWWRFGRRPAR
ncbi:hypothetical protein EJV47_24130 [Hymenobacter gummosus]|uniref:Uncharacterized protein n=1 Tax=Hymenobacter gummosus TaxID=1776032 RepID=A0A3S0QEX5_9BACT|nr:hypothetical protein [Hymenobacter gummosus]RTQ45921.1 hypothetical protein EJV47_24130 [Hymenobacter gummosus]